ncbi:hypothetical protein ONS95_012747 [Cadophora gregata]|uniref:uncharacterized protein n=1 Tax=Cadophora gregata TaxID=51156 RepID=UPI0026DB96A2|nr:uncharacterized protein ONS95_012747 [Cadophora gregata]KAK0118462.1 hypothetical protein ONS95_012747 [Cadophora gregata]KAK0123531.1 hypothetical protein ONS96_010513 [Cadophora gregata f. sp. sojae]
MLPPIDDAILQSNPRFSALYSTLAKQILNPNGSTKIHPAQKERDAVSEALNACRLRSAKSQLLKSALQHLDLSPPPSTSTSTSRTTTTKSSRQSQIQQSKPQSQTPVSLPPELLELIIVLSSRLSSPALSPSQSRTLQSTALWASLPTHLPQIGSLLSTHLQTQALALCRILSPTTNPSFLHRQIPKLYPSIRDQQRLIKERRVELAKRRRDLVSHTTTLLTLHHLATALVIRTLEQSTHGSLSRYIKARSEYLSLKAAQVLYEARAKRDRGERVVYTEEVRSALENYVGELRGGRERGRERRAQAERTLWGYGIGREDGEEKERILREIARVYGELSKEVEEVGRDVQRLRGR